MDAVAEAAGVSKQTVYSHFGDKENLFVACIEHKVSSHQLAETVDPGQATVGEALTLIATRYMSLFSDPDVAAMMRVVIATSAGNQDIPRLFEESGPAPSLGALARVLEAYAAAGALDIRHAGEAAEVFTALIRGEWHRRLLMNLIEPPEPEEQKRRVRDVVKQFLAIYEPRP